MPKIFEISTKIIKEGKKCQICILANHTILQSPLSGASYITWFFRSLYIRQCMISLNALRDNCKIGMVFLYILFFYINFPEDYFLYKLPED